MDKNSILVNPANLKPEQKRQLWAGIKKCDPQLAQLIQKDPAMNALKKEFNASIRFSQADFNRYMAAGSH